MRDDQGSGSTNDADRKKKMYADVMVEVERHFRPEFLNRVDESIVFNPLTHEDLTKIVHLQLNEVRERLTEHELTLNLTDNAIEFLITKGFHEDYGARPLRRAIERFIEDPMAEQLLRGNYETGATIWLDRSEDAESLVFSDSNPELQPVEAGVGE